MGHENRSNGGIVARIWCFYHYSNIRIDERSLEWVYNNVFCSPTCDSPEMRFRKYPCGLSARGVVVRVSDIPSIESSTFMHGRQLLRWNFSKKLIFWCVFCLWKLLKPSQVVKLRFTSCEHSHEFSSKTHLYLCENTSEGDRMIVPTESPSVQACACIVSEYLWKWPWWRGSHNLLPEGPIV